MVYSLLSIGNQQAGTSTPTSQSLVGHWQLSLAREGGPVLQRSANGSRFSRAKEVPGRERALERVPKSAVQVLISFIPPSFLSLFFFLPFTLLLFLCLSSSLSWQIVLQATGAPVLGTHPLLKRNNRICVIGQRWGLGPPGFGPSRNLWPSGLFFLHRFPALVKPCRSAQLPARAPHLLPARSPPWACDSAPLRRRPSAPLVRGVGKRCGRRCPPLPRP